MSSAPYSLPGALCSHTRSERALSVQCGDLHMQMSVLTPQIIRVRVSSDHTFPPRRSWAVTPPDDAFAPVSFEVEESSQFLTLRTAAMALQINRQTGHIACFDTAGRVFCADERGVELGTPEDEAPLFINDVAFDPALRVACSKRIEEGEHFLGFGERTGALDRRGQQMLNWTTDPAIDQGHGINTDPLYIAIPWCMVVRPGLTYGVFFNNTWRSRFSIGWDRPGTWQMEAHGGDMDYYVLLGPTPAEVCSHLGILLGTLPMPPRWALGYHQSRWGYATDTLVREVAANFRQRALPCDVIHLDIDYMHGYRVFTWDTADFPDPPRLINELRDQGFRIVTIIDPGVKIDPEYTVYRDGLDKNMYIRQPSGELFRGYVWPGAAVFPDFTRPEVRQWWGDWHRSLLDQGVSGIWTDMNEPTSFDRPFSAGIGVVGTIATDCPQGPADEQTSHAEVHNLYGSGMAQATHEGMLRHRANERPFVLTRSGFAGVQRWSACWMGDNSSVWEHLEMTMPQLMNMGLSGAPFAGTDIGGFFGNCNGELLARWLQLGALVPFCRGHSCTGTAPQEPWVFGPQVESICRDYLNLRYRLLPYLYSLFWEATRSGAPVLRPLLYHFPDDMATYTLHDQVMLGPFLLAAPIYQPGRTARAVYLPAGDWFDWWTDERISGPTHVLAQAPLERMPLYVRGGAILPTGPVMNHTAERSLDPLTLEVFPGNGSFTLYEDDGHSLAYEQGQFCTTHYSLEHTAAGGLTLSVGARTGAYQPDPRQCIIRLHAVEQAAGSQYPDARYDSQQRVLSLWMPDTGAEHRLQFAHH